MRAIVKCTASGHTEGKNQCEKLQKLLDQHNWCPRLSADDRELETRKAEILLNVADDDRNLVEKTFFCTIYDEDSKTWGIVNNPTSHAFTFRLKNPISDRLKAATEKLVADLSGVTSGGKAAGNGPFEFHNPIVVLEPTSQHHAFVGEVLPAKGLILAMKEKKRETYVGGLTIFLTVVFMILSLPWTTQHLFGQFSQSFQDWIAGNLSRFSTAALVTATISWFEVILYWFQERRHSAVRWTLE